MTFFQGAVWERVWPYLGGALAFAFWHFLGAPFPQAIEPLMGAAGTVASVLIGFLGTTKAILLSVSRSPTYKQLKQAGFTDLIFSYILEAVALGLMLLVLSLVGFFFSSPVPRLFAGLWMLVAALAVMLYARTVWIIFKFVRKA